MVNGIVPAHYRGMPVARRLAVELQLHFPAKQNLFPGADGNGPQHKHVGAVRLDPGLLSPKVLGELALQERQNFCLPCGGGGFHFIKPRQDRISCAPVQAKEQAWHRNELKRGGTLDLEDRGVFFKRLLQVGIVELVAAWLAIVPRTGDQAVDLESRKAAQGDFDAVLEQGEKVEWGRSPNGELQIAVVGQCLCQGHVSALRGVGKERAGTPVGVRGEAVRAGDEPGGNPGRDGVEFELYRDFVAGLPFLDCIPLLCIIGRVEGQPLDHQADFPVLQRAVGQVKAFHEAQEMIPHGGRQVAPQFVHVSAGKDAQLANDLIALQHLADIFRHPLRFENDQVVEFLVILVVQDVAQFVQPLCQYPRVVAGDAVRGHNLPQFLRGDVLFFPGADRLGCV